MYHEFYGLNRMPFQGSPDPDFLFAGPTHQEALASLEYGVEAGMGFILVTGEVGLGKTTLIRTFLRRAQRPELFVIYVFHPLLSFDALLALMCEELELAGAETESYQRIRAIQRNLIQRFEAGQRVVLIIDEAHRLPLETLENLRLISNLETDSAKLLQIMIVGQPELEAMLAEPRLRQLDQRIALRTRLEPLSRRDGASYIRHRLQQAGAPPETVLGDGGIRAISAASGGVPRRINALADFVLIHGFGAGERPIGRRCVRHALRSERRNARPSDTSRRAVRWSLLVASVLASLVMLMAVLSNAAPTVWLERLIRSEVGGGTDLR